jgi:hypothetical protein
MCGTTFNPEDEGSMYLRNVCTTVRRKSHEKKLSVTTMDEVLYGSETLSLTLREEHRLRVFENGAENIWTEERCSDGRLGKTA